MAATATPASSSNVHQTESIRETIDSIVVALILAFVFRAFVVEAFIIPTGSMAPTLYGAHGTILCEDCGTEFAYGLLDPSDPRKAANQSWLVKQNSTAVCPNCKHRNRDLKVNDIANNTESGDRILVLKWPLDLQIAALGPKRWEVTVFKDPKDGETNFIKRLVGLPNEVLSIIDGDVYAAPVSQLSKETMDELTAIARNKHKLLEPGREKTGEWELRGKVQTPSALALEDIYNHLSIKEKPEVAQKSLWFTVYDHDFPPTKSSKEPYQPAWQVALGEASGWKIGERSAHFKDQKQPDDNIVLQGETFKATCAYNIFANEDYEVVSDHRVRFVLTPETADGTVKIRLAKQGRTFWATVNVNGAVGIFEEESPLAKSPFNIKGKVSPLVAGKPVEIAFENLDYKLSLHIRGQEVLATSRDSKSPNYYGPDVKGIVKYRGPATNSPQIHGAGGSFDLTHLAIERDVHYFTHQGSNFGKTLPRGGWGSETNPILLREGEYFMLGDNTNASYDSRLWDVVDERFVQRGENYQLGTVPADQLIGQAFFVYWPSGRRLEWIPSLRFGIIPDVGRMRWIR